MHRSYNALAHSQAARRRPGRRAGAAWI